MQLVFSTHGDIQIVTISGNIDRYSAGRLYDALVEVVHDGNKKLIVDLSGVDRLTSAGMRGLVVAAKLLQSPGSAMRLSGVDFSVEEFLRGRGHDHLLKCDPTVKCSVKALSPSLSAQDGLPGAGWSAAIHHEQNRPYSLL